MLAGMLERGQHHGSLVWWGQRQAAPSEAWLIFHGRERGFLLTLMW